MAPSGVVPATIAVRNERGPAHGAGRLLYRSPAAVGDEERRSVLRVSGRYRSILIENLEAMQFDDVLALVPDLGIELLQRELFEALHRCQGIGVDADRVPGLENLCSELEGFAGLGAQLERGATRSKPI